MDELNKREQELAQEVKDWRLMFYQTRDELMATRKEVERLKEEMGKLHEFLSWVERDEHEARKEVERLKAQHAAVVEARYEALEWAIREIDRLTVRRARQEHDANEARKEVTRIREYIEAKAGTNTGTYVYQPTSVAITDMTVRNWFLLPDPRGDEDGEIAAGVLGE